MKIKDRTHLTLILLIGQMFFLTITLSLFMVAVYALFVDTLGSDALPYSYIAAGIVGTALGAAYAWLQGRWGLLRAGFIAFSIFIALMILSWWSMRSSSAAWLAFTLMVAVSPIMSIGLITVGTQAGRVFDLRQMKTLYPYVISAMLAGFALGGLLATLLVGPLGGTPNLLLLAGGTMVVSLAFMVLMAQRFGDQLGQTESAPATTKKSAKATKTIRQLLTKPYVRVLFSYQMLSTMGTLLMIYLYFDQADAQFSDAEALASFFGTMTVVREVSSLLFTSLFASRLLGRYGMGLGLTANPVVVGAAIVVMAVVSLTGSGSLFFWVVVTAYLLDVSLSDGMTGTSVKTAYQAVPEDQRATVETAVEGIGIPVAQGLTGVLIVLFNLLGGLLPVIIVAIIVAAVWTLMGFRVYRNYAGTLLQSLSRRRLSSVEFSLADADSVTAVERLLESPKISTVRLALDAMTMAEHDGLDQHLMRLTQHETTDVRVEAIQRIEVRRLEAALPTIQTVLEVETEPIVRGTAVRALASITTFDSLDDIQQYLDDGHSETSIGAMVGLLRYGGIPGVLAAGRQLTQLEESHDPAKRKLVAQVIGQVGIDNFFQPLISLLQDPSTDVRRAALVASARVHHPRLLPYVIDNLANPLTRSAAMSALQALGEDLLPTTASALARETNHTEEDIIRMVRVCGQIKGDKVIEILKPHIDHPDNDVQLSVLLALDLCGYRPETAVDQAEINRTVLGEVRHGLRVLLAKQDLSEDEATLPQLFQALDHEFDEARKRTFLLLSFLYEAEAILRAEEQLQVGRSSDQAIALETLDLTLSNEQKRLLFPLADPKLTDEQRIAQLQEHFSIKNLSRYERLTEIIADPESEWTHGWTRACALYLVGKLRLTELVAVVEQAVAIEEHPVQETAVWAQNALVANF
ncbi:MAG: HEAT repeat domain-containing protein [Chloroflexota bacterium]